VGREGREESELWKGFLARVTDWGQEEALVPGGPSLCMVGFFFGPRVGTTVAGKAWGRCRWLARSVHEGKARSSSLILWQSGGEK